jgi:hypothetical protein
MARQLITKAVVIAATDYAHPARVLKPGDVVELSAAEVTAIGAGNLRATAFRDQLGLAVGVSNSN